MKKVLKLTIVFLWDLAFLSPLTIAQAATEPDYLFVENAAGGTITGPDDQHLTLKLTKVRDYVTFFTNRPTREAEAVQNADFFKLWPQMFLGDPPNAVLSFGLPGQAMPLNIILTLTNPQYDAKKHTVTYDAMRIRQDEDIPARFPNGDRRSVNLLKLPKRFRHASLFIDSGARGVCDIGGPQPCMVIGNPMPLR
jgi:hypothetical protein